MTFEQLSLGAKFVFAEHVAMVLEPGPTEHLDLYQKLSDTLAVMTITRTRVSSGGGERVILVLDS